MNLLAIMAILCSIESSNNQNAIGDKGKAYGILQIHKIMIKDHNRIYKTKFVHNDAFDPELSKLIFCNIVFHYFGNKDKYKPKDICSLWNAGAGWRKADTEKQRNLDIYYTKFLKELNK